MSHASKSGMVNFINFPLCFVSKAGDSHHIPTSITLLPRFWRYVSKNTPVGYIGYFPPTKPLLHFVPGTSATSGPFNWSTVLRQWSWRRIKLMSWEGPSWWWGLWIRSWHYSQQLEEKQPMNNDDFNVFTWKQPRLEDFLRYLEIRAAVVSSCDCFLLLPSTQHWVSVWYLLSFLLILAIDISKPDETRHEPQKKTSYFSFLLVVS